MPLYVAPGARTVTRYNAEGVPMREWIVPDVPALAGRRWRWISQRFLYFECPDRLDLPEVPDTVDPDGVNRGKCYPNGVPLDSGEIIEPWTDGLPEGNSPLAHLDNTVLRAEAERRGIIRATGVSRG